MQKKAVPIEKAPSNKIFLEQFKIETNTQTFPRYKTAVL